MLTISDDVEIPLFHGGDQTGDLFRRILEIRIECYDDLSADD